MKISKILHLLSILFGISGLLALVGYYAVGQDGAIFGMNQAHLFRDAGILVAFALWFLLGAIHHLLLEKKGEMV